jgi:hypothetical protein
MQTVKDIETVTIGQITEDLQKVTTLLWTLCVKLWIQAKQYNIFIEHQSKTLQYIGLFQSYQIPKKLANNYKEKESIQIIVNNETQAIITNGEVYDIFDIT